ncbi:MAG: type II toxin-antitoxin system VapC family toxin [Acidobacteriota bacterium]
MIFIDSNIPMYLVGGSPKHQADAQVLVDRSFAAHERIVTNVEVFQEILHRYISIQRREAIDDAFRVLLGIVDSVLPLDEVDVMRARDIVQTAPLSARDALHIAVMQRHGIRRILSFDADFDRWPGIERVWQV